KKDWNQAVKVMSASACGRAGAHRRGSEAQLVVDVIVLVVVVVVVVDVAVAAAQVLVIGGCVRGILG
ncbi:jg812, partial [Pararge aegeria aegeria]